MSREGKGENTDRIFRFENGGPGPFEETAQLESKGRKARNDDIYLRSQQDERRESESLSGPGVFEVEFTDGNGGYVFFG